MCNITDSQKINSAIHIMRRYGYKKDATILTKYKHVKIVFKDLSEVILSYSQANAITIKNLNTGEVTVYINKDLRDSSDVGIACLLVHESQHVASSTTDTLSQEIQAVSKEMEFYLVVLNKDPSIQNRIEDRLIRRLNSIKDGYDLIIKTYITQNSSYQKLLNINMK